MLWDDDCCTRLDEVLMSCAESSKVKSCAPKPSRRYLLSPDVPLAPTYYQQAAKLKSTSAGSLLNPFLVQGGPSVRETAVGANGLYRLRERAIFRKRREKRGWRTAE